MDRQIRLNLGCGSAYKPGCINMDRYDTSVADTICDLDHLPIESNAVDVIEASQVIEHFDYAHCKYALAEWFRVLRPEGTLILETPDLEKTSQKLISSDLETQRTTLQWIYGIDSLGMQHKTGFTSNLLKGLLEEIGFEKISREKPRTHVYEHGIRTVCRKPGSCFDKQLFACFRKRLKSKLGTNDSCVLIPLESWLNKIFDIYTASVKDKETCVNKIISRTVICHPYVPLAFLEECMALGVLEESEVKAEIDLLNWLDEMQFHRKVFSLWMKSKKGVKRLEEECTDFITRHERLMLDILNDCSQYKGSLEYITALEPADIEIFDFLLVSLEARKAFNQGVRCFDMGQFRLALDSFLKSSKINPGYPLSYWNMARICSILGMEEHETVANYEKALKLVKGGKAERSLAAELKHVRQGRSDRVPREPLSEDSLTF